MLYLSLCFPQVFMNTNLKSCSHTDSLIARDMKRTMNVRGSIHSPVYLVC